MGDLFKCLRSQIETRGLDPPLLHVAVRHSIRWKLRKLRMLLQLLNFMLAYTTTSFYVFF